MRVETENIQSLRYRKQNDKHYLHKATNYKGLKIIVKIVIQKLSKSLKEILLFKKFKSNQ